MVNDLFHGHSVCFYDYFGHLQFSSNGEDLLQVLMSTRRVVVDTNSEWKTKSLNNPCTSFILGHTIATEADNLDGVLFNEKVSDGRTNVFVFGVEPFKGRPQLGIHRLDLGFNRTLKRPIPSLSDCTSADISKWNDPHKRAVLAARIASIEQQPEHQIRQTLQSVRHACKGRFAESCNAAEMAFALLLLWAKSKNGRLIRLLEVNNPNIFNDAALIRDGLFFDAEIASNDKHLKQMAAFCSIPCHH